MKDGFCALRARELFFFCCWGLLRGGEAKLSLQGFKKAKQGLPFERQNVYPAGTKAFIFFNLGRLRGARQMGAC